MNVGSVGRPKDGDPRAMYVLLHPGAGGDVDVQIGRVSYDVEAAAQAIVVAGLPPELVTMARQGHSGAM